MVFDRQSHSGPRSSDEVDISVVISSYNRCAILPEALESILNQHAAELKFEVIVVDNNSTDRTREVIESYAGRNVRYVFEPKQGPSHGRNAGIAQARGKIIAFTDDDVRPETDWLRNIKLVFDSHAEVDCVGGKILPQWKTAPPRWLTVDHWAPLAIQDYGNSPIFSTPAVPICWSTSNISYRSSVFDRIGGFSGDFKRSQDRELMNRFMRDGGRMMYAPNVIVTTEIPDERLTKTYHRSWHTTSGKYHALMQLHESTGRDGQILKEPLEVVRLFGVPGFLYRELVKECGRWFVATLRLSHSLSFKHENRLRYWRAYLRESRRQQPDLKNGSRLGEVLRFVKAMVRRRTHSTSN
jgi:glycosyltransferase involved in cell wall biosynthesis